MQINEIFYSIQGEGLLSGLPTIFIRTTGCNLRCKYCDSTYAYDKGTSMTFDDILRSIDKYTCKEVCVTGGEPLLQNETFELLTILQTKGYHICLETNGSKRISSIHPRDHLTISLDIKCPSSEMHTAMDLSNILALSTHDQLKFIIATRGDYEYAKGVLQYSEVPCTVFFQPVWGSNISQLAEWIIKDNLVVRLGLQVHKIIWGEREGV
jgi:7-carboxy-7-deazaguanine synthase